MGADAASLTWNFMNNDFCNSKSAAEIENGNKLAPIIQTTDVYANVLYWLQINTFDSWKLAGTSWLSLYETEFIK